jgi:hypothetical protein
VLQELLDEILSNGWELGYLRGPKPWECQILSRLDPPVQIGSNIYHYEVAFGAADAIFDAIYSAIDATADWKLCEPIRVYHGKEVDERPSLSSLIGAKHTPMNRRF